MRVKTRFSHTIVLDETLNGVEVLCSMWVCPVGRCVLDISGVSHEASCVHCCAMVHYIVRMSPRRSLGVS